MGWKELAYLDDVGISGTPDVSWERFQRSQRYQCTMLANCTALTTLALTANRLYAIPFLVCGSHKYIRISINVTTLLAGNARLGIYTDEGVYPKDLILDAGEVSTGTTGMKEIVIDQTLESGLYWLVIVAGAAATVRAAAVASCMPILGLDGALATTPGNGWWVAFTYGVLPNPFPAGGTIGVASNPVIAMLRE